MSNKNTSTVNRDLKETLNSQAAELRIPSWLRTSLPKSGSFNETRSLVTGMQLSTVCQNAKCPNIHECFSSGTATFLILGNICTRNCAFCNISTGRPLPVNQDEPERLAKAAAFLRLKYVVVTSVTRDDLEDGGAGHFAETIREVRKLLPGSGIEVLIPDFQGEASALKTVIEAAPRVINHNIETHPDLYPNIRPQADYQQSIQLLEKVQAAGITAKSGFMVGLGENDEQVEELLHTLKQSGCSMVTIGQYMRPSMQHPQVRRYVHPETFASYAEIGKKIGIPYVFSGPLVRSSYHALDAAMALHQS